MTSVNTTDLYFSLVSSHSPPSPHPCSFITKSVSTTSLPSNAEFQDNLKQRLSTNTEAERADWIQAIRQASYEEMRKKLKNLQEKIEKRRDNKQDVDVDMMRLQGGKEIGDLIQF